MDNMVVWCPIMQSHNVPYLFLWWFYYAEIFGMFESMVSFPCSAISSINQKLKAYCAVGFDIVQVI